MINLNFVSDLVCLYQFCVLQILFKFKLEELSCESIIGIKVDILQVLDGDFDCINQIEVWLVQFGMYFRNFVEV